MPPLTSRFLSLPLSTQIDSIFRTKVHDVTRLSRFINHCLSLRNMPVLLRDLDKVHRERFDKLIQIYNLTQDKSIVVDGINGQKHTMEKKFESLNALLDVVINGESNGLLICGGPGIGKSYTAERALEAAGKPFYTLRGYSSNIELYNFLFDHKNKIVLIDDADSVFDDLITLNMLKAILETTPERKVCWLTPSHMLRAPDNFKFTGKVIFITNLTVEKMNAHMAALLSRILYVNFDVSREDIIRRITMISKGTSYKNLIRADRVKISSFIKSNQGVIRDLSLRTLVHGYDIFLHDRVNWRKNLRFMWNGRR